MTYRCEAKTVTGFVQQFACCYVLHGYHHYVTGRIPERKDPAEVDSRIVERYGIDLSRFQRARRKRAGLPNHQYLRFKHFFVLCSSGPRDPRSPDPDDLYFDSEFHKVHRNWVLRRGKKVRQIRWIVNHPLSFAGYSIGYHRGRDRKWHVSVRIHPERYRDTKAYLLDVASKRSVGNLVEEFRGLPWQPYAPVTRQLLDLLRAVNRERKLKGWDLVRIEHLDAAWQKGTERRAKWLQRKQVFPFGFETGGTELEGEAA